MAVVGVLEKCIENKGLEKSILGKHSNLTLFFQITAQLMSNQSFTSIINVILSIKSHFGSEFSSHLN